jgi:hypothetical protein
MSEREALYGTKHKTEKIRPPSFKNLVDFFSLSLSLSLLTATIQTNSFLLNSAEKFLSLLSIFCLRRRTLLLCVCVFSLFLSKMVRARVEERARVFLKNQ